MIMNKKAVLSVLFAVVAVCAAAQEFNPVPRAWKWTSDQDVVFSYFGTFTDDAAGAEMMNVTSSPSTIG